MLRLIMIGLITVLTQNNAQTLESGIWVTNTDKEYLNSTCNDIAPIKTLVVGDSLPPLFGGPRPAECVYRIREHHFVWLPIKPTIFENMREISFLFINCPGLHSGLLNMEKTEEFAINTQVNCTQNMTVLLEIAYKDPAKEIEIEKQEVLKSITLEPITVYKVHMNSAGKRVINATTITCLNFDKLETYKNRALDEYGQQYCYNEVKEVDIPNESYDNGVFYNVTAQDQVTITKSVLKLSIEFVKQLQRPTFISILQFKKEVNQKTIQPLYSHQVPNLNCASIELTLESILTIVKHSSSLTTQMFVLTFVFFIFMVCCCALFVKCRNGRY